MLHFVIGFSLGAIITYLAILTFDYIRRFIQPETELESNNAVQYAWEWILNDSQDD